MERLEGNGASQFVQLIRKHGYNKEIDIELATVTAAPPNLKIKVDNMSVELESDDLIVSEYLTNHSRTVTISGGTVSGGMTSNTHNHTVSDYSHAHTESGGGTTSTDTHNHTLGDVIHDHTLNSLTVTSGTITFENELKKDERVIVANINDGQTYVILDRAVTY